MNTRQKYDIAYINAVLMLKTTDIEIRSALKQAGSDVGIKFGKDMGEFVHYAEKRMGVA